MIGVRTPGAPQLAAHLEAVLARQHHIEQDEVERLRACRRAPRRRRRNRHVVTFGAQVGLKGERDARLVFDNQDRGSCPHLLAAQHHGETAALAGLARDATPSPPCASHDLADHGETDAGALDARRWIGAANEPVEDLALLVAGNPQPLIADHDGHVVAGGLKLHPRRSGTRAST